MNVFSTLIGTAALVAALVGLIPLLGWLNWLVIPVVASGWSWACFPTRPVGNINLVVLAIAAFRLFMGEGLFKNRRAFA